MSPADNPIDPSLRFAVCAQLQHALSGAGAVAIFIADGRLPDAPIVYVNDRFTQTTGLLREQVIGRSWKLLSTRPTGALAAFDDRSGAAIPVELPDFGGDVRSAGTPFNVHRLRDRSDGVTAYVGLSRLVASLD